MVAEISGSLPVPSPCARTERVVPATAAQEAARYDAALAGRFKAGDDAAFDEIIARYREKLSAVAFSILRNHADAEEIAQDALINAHRHLHTFRGTCSLATWLHTIALNLSRNRYWYHFRRGFHVTQSLDCAMGEDNPATFAEFAASDAPGPVGEATTREFSAVVISCIAKLAPRHREILERRIVDGRSYDEIAEALRISLGTVKSRVARGRERLRALLALACPEFAPNAASFEWFDTVRPGGGWRRGG